MDGFMRVWMEALERRFSGAVVVGGQELGSITNTSGQNMVICRKYSIFRTLGASPEATRSGSSGPRTIKDRFWGA
jgi:hypothetical protein